MITTLLIIFMFGLEEFYWLFKSCYSFLFTCSSQLWKHDSFLTPHGSTSIKRGNNFVYCNKKGEGSWAYKSSTVHTFTQKHPHSPMPLFFNDIFSYWSYYYWIIRSFSSNWPTKVVSTQPHTHTCCRYLVPIFVMKSQPKKKIQIGSQNVRLMITTKIIILITLLNKAQG